MELLNLSSVARIKTLRSIGAAGVPHTSFVPAATHTAVPWTPLTSTTTANNATTRITATTSTPSNPNPAASSSSSAGHSSIHPTTTSQSSSTAPTADCCSPSATSSSHGPSSDTPASCSIATASSLTTSSGITKSHSSSTTLNDEAASVSKPLSTFRKLAFTEDGSSEDHMCRTATSAADWSSDCPSTALHDSALVSRDDVLGTSCCPEDALAHALRVISEISEVWEADGRHYFKIREVRSAIVKAVPLVGDLRMEMEAMKSQLSEYRERMAERDATLERLRSDLADLEEARALYRSQMAQLCTATVALPPPPPPPPASAVPPLPQHPSALPQLGSAAPRQRLSADEPHPAMSSGRRSGKLPAAQLPSLAEQGDTEDDSDWVKKESVQSDDDGAANWVPSTLTTETETEAAAVAAPCTLAPVVEGFDEEEAVASSCNPGATAAMFKTRSQRRLSVQMPYTEDSQRSLALGCLTELLLSSDQQMLLSTADTVAIEDAAFIASAAFVADNSASCGATGTVTAVVDHKPSSALDEPPSSPSSGSIPSRHRSFSSGNGGASTDGGFHLDSQQSIGMTSQSETAVAVSPFSFRCAAKLYAPASGEESYASPSNVSHKPRTPRAAVSATLSREAPVSLGAVEVPFVHRRSMTAWSDFSRTAATVLVAAASEVSKLWPADSKRSDGGGSLISATKSASYQDMQPSAAAHGSGPAAAAAAVAASDHAGKLRARRHSYIWRRRSNSGVSSGGTTLAATGKHGSTSEATLVGGRKEPTFVWLNADELEAATAMVL